jgi:hypothetical protein
MYQKSEKVNIAYQLFGYFKRYENIKQTAFILGLLYLCFFSERV